MEGDRYPEQYDARFEISIHALRVEGDSMREVVTLKEYYISIHALRVEGDVIYIFIFVFVPSISIHALRVEGDPHNMYAIACTHFISIHALRVEGDHPSAKSISKKFYFYPRPPGGGRQQKRTKFSSVFAKKGEEFASLRRGKRKICRWRFKKDKFWVLIWCEGSRKSVCALASHCG